MQNIWSNMIYGRDSVGREQETEGKKTREKDNSSKTRTKTRIYQIYLRASHDAYSLILDDR